MCRARCKAAERPGRTQPRLEFLPWSRVCIPGDPSALQEQPKGSQIWFTEWGRPKGGPRHDIALSSAPPDAVTPRRGSESEPALPLLSSLGDPVTAWAFLRLSTENSPTHDPSRITLQMPREHPTTLKFPQAPRIQTRHAHHPAHLLLLPRPLPSATPLYLTLLHDKFHANLL